MQNVKPTLRYHFVVLTCAFVFFWCVTCAQLVSSVPASAEILTREQEKCKNELLTSIKKLDNTSLISKKDFLPRSALSNKEFVVVDSVTWKKYCRYSLMIHTS